MHRFWCGCSLVLYLRQYLYLKNKMTDKKRTAQQNKAMHKYFENLADALNAAGLDMKTVLKPEVEIPWSKESVKNFLWRPIQTVYTDKESTADANTLEIQAIYKILDRHLAEKFGIQIEWPNNEYEREKTLP